MKRFLICVAFFAIGIALFAQSADSDFETLANFDGTITITKYVGWDTEVVIPAKIGGKAVTAIGKEAFKGADLTKVTIPAGVQTIGESAFMGNKLTSVVIPEGVQTIGSSAFKENPLASVTLPGSLRFIGQYSVFGEVPKTFILGANIGVGSERLHRQVLGDTAFYNYIANGRKAGTYTADMLCEEKETEDYTYMGTQFGAVLTRYKGSGNRVRVPAEIDGVAVKALVRTFSGKRIANLMIPEGITYIGDNAFNDNQLTSVSIPASVTYIGDRAFSSNQLTSVTIPASVTYIGEYAFLGNHLTSVTIPASVTYIGGSAFRGGINDGDNKLTSVTITQGVTYIGEWAFRGNQLTNVTIPASVTYIGGGAFEFNQLTSLVIPPSVIYLEGNSFDYERMKTIVIGANVEVGKHSGWGFGAFYDKNGRKAGRYAYVETKDNRGRVVREWTYRAE